MYELSDERCREVAEAFKAHGSKQRAADALGLPVSTYKHQLKIAAKRGLVDMPEVLPGFEIKGVSTLYDRDGNKVQEWVKTSAEPSVLDVADVLKGVFTDTHSPAILLPPPADPNPDLLTLYPLADWHLGLYAWQAEVGHNWDLALAEKALGDGMAHVIASSPSSERAVVLGGGDLFHSDNSSNQTSRSGHALDVDGRYAKVIETGARLLVKVVDLALQRHHHVTVRILQGNHDEHSSIAVSYFLLAWYRNEPRVTVDVDPSLFFWFRFGLTMLGASHGHTVKIKDMPGIMAHRRAEDWGATKFRYVHGFHLHHTAKFATEGQGVISEIHQSPAPQDAWHFASGFLSGRSLQSITYHAERGEVARNRMAVL